MPGNNVQRDLKMLSIQDETDVEGYTKQYVKDDYSQQLKEPHLSRRISPLFLRHAAWRVSTRTVSGKYASP
jgi:hypothetical protein